MDSQQIEHVLLNLVRNASQAIGPRDSVVRAGVETREQLRSVHLSQGAAERGRYAVQTIADDGEGMDQSVQHRLFKPLFSTRVTGNGLGLATVKRIVSDHHGTLDVRSKRGHGGTITLWLPVPDAQDAESPRAAEKARTSTLSSTGDRAERLKLENDVDGYPALLKTIGPGLPVVIVGDTDMISQMADGAGSQHLAPAALARHVPRRGRATGRRPEILCNI